MVPENLFSGENVVRLTHKADGRTRSRMRMQDGSPRPRAATLMPQRRAASRSPKSPWLTHPSEGGAHATKMTSRRERCPRPRASTVDCFAALSEPATFDVRFVGARAGHPAVLIPCCPEACQPKGGVLGGRSCERSRLGVRFDVAWSGCGGWGAGVLEKYPHRCVSPPSDTTAACCVAVFRVVVAGRYLVSRFN